MHKLLLLGKEIITVRDDPVCADGFNWWQVAYSGGVGWTVEGTLDEYWIIPYEAEPHPTPVAPTL